MLATAGRTPALKPMMEVWGLKRPMLRDERIVRGRQALRAP